MRDEGRAQVGSQRPGRERCFPGLPRPSGPLRAGCGSRPFQDPDTPRANSPRKEKIEPAQRGHGLCCPIFMIMVLSCDDAALCGSVSPGPQPGEWVLVVSVAGVAISSSGMSERPVGRPSRSTIAAGSALRTCSHESRCRGSMRPSRTAAMTSCSCSAAACWAAYRSGAVAASRSASSSAAGMCTTSGCGSGCGAGGTGCRAGGPMSWAAGGGGGAGGGGSSGACLGCERRVERRYLPGVAESRRADLAPDPGDVGGVGRGHRGPPAGTAAWSCAAARSLPTRLATSDRVV